MSDTATPTAADSLEDSGSVQDTVPALLARARRAQRIFAEYDQSAVDDVVAGVAWAIYRADRAHALAEASVAGTGLGRVPDKVTKNKRKTLGTLRDLAGARSVGVINHDPARGLTEYAKPVGVVAALCPSTNPAATPANKAMMILKGRNAAILSPSPKGTSTCRLLVEYVHAELDKVGAPRDLVQFLDPPSKHAAEELMRQADFVVVTGSQRNVRQAYSSGTPAIGVGAGNAPVIVHSDADIPDAAEKIKCSKTFDYATSCSSENSLHVHSSVYDHTLSALVAEGGYLLNSDEKHQLKATMWQQGKLNPAITAQAPARIAELAGLADPRAHRAEFFMVEEDGVGPSHPFSGEKLSVVLAVYRYDDLTETLDRIQRILDYQGAGHSCGIHTAEPDNARIVAQRLRVARVLVNQSHCFGTGGGFDNGLGFTLTMGAGTWAGNSTTENLSYRHFLNITRLSTVISPNVPDEDELWGEYFRKYGR